MSQMLMVKDPFHVQAELIDVKVKMAIHKNMDRIIKQVSGLEIVVHDEIQKLKNDSDYCFSLLKSLEKRVSSIEELLAVIGTSRLGAINTVRTESCAKWFGYSVKAGWLALGGAITYSILLIHALLAR